MRVELAGMDDRSRKDLAAGNVCIEAASDDRCGGDWLTIGFMPLG
jgi:hypothetical protein